MKFYIVLLLVLIPLVNADLGTFQQDSCVNIKTILNATSVNISTINYPNSTTAISNQLMDKTGQTFNYTFCDTSTEGVYIYDYFDNENNVYVNSFEITYTGQELTNSKTYLYLASILVLFLLGLTVIWFNNKLPTSNMQEEDGRIIQVVWAKHLRIPLWGLLYLCVMGVFYMIGTLGIAYLGGVFGKLFFGLYLAMGWIGIPLTIILGLRLFDNILADNKIKSWMEKGIDVDGK